MKKCCVILIFLTCFTSSNIKAQTTEIEQLLLNLEKLTQFKQILQNMYDGYKILHQGYTAIKDISEGNFSLHQTFLDKLMQVSSAVKKYHRVASIIDYQLKIAKTSKASIKQFKEDKSFSNEELEHIIKVYEQVLSRSLKSLDELLMVITSGTLRMSDDERLEAIDKIFGAIEDQFVFIQSYTRQTAIHSLQRKSEQAEVIMSERLHNPN